MTRAALRGWGAPAGTEDDAASSYLWLQACHLAPTKALLTVLTECLASELPRPSFRNDGDGDAGLDLNGASCVLFSSSIVELAAVVAARGIRLGVTDATAPLFTVPMMVRTARRGCWIRSQWRVSDVDYAFCCGPRGEPSLTASALDDDTHAHARAEHWWIECRHDTFTDAAFARQGACDLLAEMDVDDYSARALANGIDIEPDVWQALDRYASRTLVPDSASSRLTGAGAGVLDDD